MAAAGVAALLTILLNLPEHRPAASLGDIRCIGFGTPCVVCPQLSGQCQDLVTSIIVG